VCTYEPIGERGEARRASRALKAFLVLPVERVQSGGAQGVFEAVPKGMKRAAQVVATEVTLVDRTTPHRSRSLLT
jgi:hypothetical protein